MTTSRTVKESLTVPTAFNDGAEYVVKESLTTEVVPLRERVGRAIFEDGRQDEQWSELSEDRREPWREDADRAIKAIIINAETEPRPSTATDALARALRLNRFGDMRPLWHEADDDVRRPWRRQAAFVMACLRGGHFYIVAADNFLELANLPHPVEEG